MNVFSFFAFRVTQEGLWCVKQITPFSFSVSLAGEKSVQKSLTRVFIQRSPTTTIGSQCIQVYPHIQQAPSTHRRINCDTLQHKCKCLATQGNVLSAQNAHANYLCYSNDTWQLLLAINRNHLL